MRVLKFLFVLVVVLYLAANQTAFFLVFIIPGLILANFISLYKAVPGSLYGNRRGGWKRVDGCHLNIEPPKALQPDLNTITGLEDLDPARAEYGLHHRF